jgi:hypothetical protein
MCEYVGEITNFRAAKSLGYIIDIKDLFNVLGEFEIHRRSTSPTYGQKEVMSCAFMYEFLNNNLLIILFNK